MSWKIRKEMNRLKCDERILNGICAELTDGETVECNEAECPYRVVNDDEEVEKMVRGTD